MLGRLKSQGFTIGLLVAVGLAFLIPEYGATGGALRSEVTTKIGIALVFLIQGLSLQTRQLLASATHVRLHIFCQSWIFILSPLLMMLIILLFGRWIQDSIEAGLLYLSVLPTTISSSIVLTSNSEGDSSAALFNATFSNIIGVFLTPLWCLSLFSNTSGQFPPLDALVMKIALFVLLPLVVGQLIRPLVQDRISAWRGVFKQSSNTVILFVVFAAFSNSFVDDTWSAFGWEAIAVALAFSTLFLLLLSSLVWTTSEISSSDPKQRIAAFYCGSQKTLAAGVPMAAVIFAGQTGNVQESLIILPIMLYHSLQLFLAGMINSRLAATTWQRDADSLH